MVLEIISSSLKHTSWERVLRFGIDRIRACLMAKLVSVCDIQSWWDHVFSFGIDRIRAYLIATLVSLYDIQSRCDCVHWFEIDCWRICVLVNIHSWRFALDWYSSRRSFMSTVFTTYIVKFSGNSTSYGLKFALDGLQHLLHVKTSWIARHCPWNVFCKV